MLRDETLELFVCVGQWLPQDDLQPPEEGHGVQAVEGETAGERQEVAGGADGAGRLVGHQVAIHGTVQSGCRAESRHIWSARTPKAVRSRQNRRCRLPAAFSARSLLGHVTLMSDAIVAKESPGQWSLEGQGAELGYNRNASSGRLSENDCSFSVWHQPNHQSNQ